MGLPWRCCGEAVSEVPFLNALRESKREYNIFHERACGYTLACLNMDILHGAAFEAAFAPKKAAGIPDSVDACTPDTLGMKAEKAKTEAALKSACQN